MNAEQIRSLARVLAYLADEQNISNAPQRRNARITFTWMS